MIQSGHSLDACPSWRDSASMSRPLLPMIIDPQPDGNGLGRTRGNLHRIGESLLRQRHMEVAAIDFTYERGNRMRDPRADAAWSQLSGQPGLIARLRWRCRDRLPIGRTRTAGQAPPGSSSLYPSAEASPFEGRALGCQESRCGIVPA